MWSTSPEVVRHVHNMSGSDPEAYRAGPVEPRLACPHCLGQGRLDPGSHAAYQARPARPSFLRIPQATRTERTTRDATRGDAPAHVPLLPAQTGAA